MPTNEFLDKLNRELGLASGGRRTPREFLTLRGTLPEACLLPTFDSEAQYDTRYGLTYSDEPNNLEMLTRRVQEGTRWVEEFRAFAGNHVGQDVLDAAEVALRNLSRVEQSIIPLCSGLTMATFGAAKSACITARAMVGTILDEKALSGEL